MPNPPRSGLLIIITETTDGLLQEYYAWDERVADDVAAIPQGNTKQQVGFVIPPSPIGLRESLASAAPDRFFRRTNSNRSGTKTVVGATIDAVFPDTTA
jgi:hypothetical protein